MRKGGAVRKIFPNFALRNEEGVMNSRLNIENITVAYDGKEVLSGFSLTAAKGECVAVTGASGCGKSSLLKAIIGIVPITEGGITVGGVELSHENVAAFRRHIAYLPQELTFPCEWVHEMVALTFTIKANSGKFDKEKLFDYMQKLGLERDIYDRRISEISGGQRQRVMIAVAALTQKDFMLLDEPTSALDAGSVRAVSTFLGNLEYRPGIIAVTHDASFASKCDRVVDLTNVKANGDN